MQCPIYRASGGKIFFIFFADNCLILQLFKFWTKIMRWIVPIFILLSALALPARDKIIFSNDTVRLERAVQCNAPFAQERISKLWRRRSEGSPSTSATTSARIVRLFSSRKRRSPTSSILGGLNHSRMRSNLI